MRIFIEKQESWIEQSFEGKAKQLLERLDINPETIVIIRNNELITEEDELRDADEVKFLSVISGG